MADATGSTRRECQEEVVVVGRLLAPHGVRGLIHVAAFTEPRDNLLEYRPWLAARDSGHARNWQAVEVLEIRPHRQGFVARLGGVEDRDAAEALRGCLIGVPASVLPAADPDEYYWRELIGARVVDTAGTLLGQVEQLMETGAHDVLVVRRPEGSRDRELLIPFHARYVIGVDRDAGRIQVDWPDEAD